MSLSDRYQPNEMVLIRLWLMMNCEMSLRGDELTCPLGVVLYSHCHQLTQVSSSLGIRYVLVGLRLLRDAFDGLL